MKSLNRLIFGLLVALFGFANLAFPAEAPSLRSPTGTQKAGIAFARKHIYPEQLEFLMHHQVDERLAAGLDKLFAPSEIQHAFKEVHKDLLLYSDHSSFHKAFDFLESKGFSFLQGKLHVFEHKDFPDLLFKTPREPFIKDDTVVRQNLGRVWLAAFINGLAVECNFKVLCAVKKSVYFATKPLVTDALQAIVVEPKIKESMTLPEDYTFTAMSSRVDRTTLFDRELARLQDSIEFGSPDKLDVWSDKNNIDGVIFDCEDRFITRELFTKYLKRFLPDLAKLILKPESKADRADQAKEEKKEAKE